MGRYGPFTDNRPAGGKDQYLAKGNILPPPKALSLEQAMAVEAEQKIPSVVEAVASIEVYIIGAHYEILISDARRNAIVVDLVPPAQHLKFRGAKEGEQFGQTDSTWHQREGSGSYYQQQTRKTISLSASEGDIVRFNAYVGITPRSRVYVKGKETTIRYEFKVPVKVMIHSSFVEVV